MSNDTHPATRSDTSNEPKIDFAQAFRLMNPAVPLDQFPAEERQEVERLRAALDEMETMKRRYGVDCYSASKVPPPACFFELLAAAEGREDPADTAERMHCKLMADWKMPEPLR